MGKRTDGTICVFLALVLLLIVSLILVFLEGARRSASESYATMLLKTAAESVMGDYYGPLFEEYHIFAIDSGFGNKTGDTDELERKLKKYIGENVWDYELKSIRAYGTKKLMERSAGEFIAQAAAYEKYGVAEDILEEIFDRVKTLGNQKTITKIMERKMGIEDELSVIDMYTLDLMKWIDGVNLTLGTKASSLLGYSIENRFIKRFFVNEISMSSTGINKPSVYEKLRDRYMDPVKLTESYVQSLKEHKKKLEESDESLRKLDAAKEALKVCKEQINTKEDELEKKQEELDELKEKIAVCEEEIQNAEKIENKKTAATKKKNYKRQKERAEKKAAEAEEQIRTLNTQIEELKQSELNIEQTVSTLEAELETVLTEIMYQEEDCKSKADEMLMLYSNTLELLQCVCETVDKVGEKQAAVGPLVDGYESFLKTVDPILSKDMKESLTDSLDYMKAYIGRGDGRIKTTDFAAIKTTALYDIELLKKADVYAFVWPETDNLANISNLLERVKGAGDVFKGFSYSGFNFDYSELKESVLENRLVAEFEKNISDGYLKLFLKSGTEVSENSLISELLPSLWYELEAVDDADSEQDPIGDPSDKGGGELLEEADEGSGLTAIGELFENGLEAGSEKFLTAAYLVHHFKSYTDKSVKGDTVLDYELEYILSGFMTDKANLSAAATKIMLLRLAICTVYTMSNSKLRSQAEIFATSIVGFTGLPFLITIVKYLVLFLWAAAQAIIETAAIMRGKKVSIIPDEKSFCLTLAELPTFASRIEEKADNFKESEIYLDYENYLLVLLLIQGKQTQAARTMDVIQENLRYKYNDDFLISNAVTGFSCDADFEAPAVFSSLFSDSFGGRFYSVNVSDSVAYD